MRRPLRNLIANKRGATAVEYGLIVSLIVIAMVASLVNLANTTITLWNNVSTKVQTAGN
ncbi:Flp family type IVb pilin [Sphingomonas sp. GlSt437]|uniref:Flp family type IVb pilin n=1 Tax=Sphingomonas sp. GlSt437 TaxID=3389970 RepID=UPI003A87D392